MSTSEDFVKNKSFETSLYVQGFSYAGRLKMLNLFVKLWVGEIFPILGISMMMTQIQ